MTEYELATLTFREMTLWVVVGHLVVGLGKIAIVWYGIRVLQHGEDRRAREEDQRHTEVMTALHELIARTARPSGSRSSP